MTLLSYVRLSAALGFLSLLAGTFLLFFPEQLSGFLTVLPKEPTKVRVIGILLLLYASLEALSIHWIIKRVRERVKLHQREQILRPTRIENRASRTVSVFPTSSESGRALATEISQLLRRKPRIRVEVYDRRDSKLSESAVLSTCLTADLVIFDATREETTSNFDIAVEPLPLLPNVLIVSRNYLPENFSGSVDALFPTYLEGTKSNVEISSFIVDNLEDLLQRRAHMDRSLHNFADRVEINPIMAKRRASRAPRAFLSYRTKYGTNVPNRPSTHGKSIAQVANDIEAGKYGSLSAFFLADGDLVYRDEVLTEQRRWYLLERILQEIRVSDEFWIYGSPDHFESWWTTTEMAQFIYCVQFLGENKKFRVYDPKSDNVCTVPPEQVPELDATQIAYLGNRFSLFNMAAERRSSLPLVTGKVVGALGRHWPTKPLVRLALSLAYAATRTYERSREDDLLGSFTRRQYLEVMTSEYYWHEVRGKPSTPDFWTQLEVIFPRTVPDRREGKENERLELPSDFNAVFDLSGCVRRPVQAAEIRRGFLVLCGKRCHLRTEKPRFIFDRSAGASKLRPVEVVRVVG